MRHARRTTRLLLLSASAAALFGMGCLGGEREQHEEEVVGVESALYDSTTPNSTALLALKDAYVKTVQNGNDYEYCGLVIKKPDGTFRATAPTTNLRPDFCSQRYDLSLNVAGYYHSHPAGIINAFSNGDKEQAKLKNWIYYLVSSDACRRRYDWKTNTTTILGCG